MIDSINIGGGDLGRLKDLSIIFIIICSLSAIFSMVRGFTFNLLGEKIMLELRYELYTR